MIVNIHESGRGVTLLPEQAFGQLLIEVPYPESASMWDVRGGDLVAEENTAHRGYKTFKIHEPHLTLDTSQDNGGAWHFFYRMDRPWRTDPADGFDDLRGQIVVYRHSSVDGPYPWTLVIRIDGFEVSTPLREYIPGLVSKEPEVVYVSRFDRVV